MVVFLGSNIRSTQVDHSRNLSLFLLTIVLYMYVVGEG